MLVNSSKYANIKVFVLVSNDQICHVFELPNRFFINPPMYVVFPFWFGKIAHTLEG